MGSPEYIGQAGQAGDVRLSARSLIGEEVLIRRAVVEGTQEEHDMVIGSSPDAASKYKGYQALIDRTVDVFGDELTASRWLSMPSPDFNGNVPLQIAQELGYEPSRVQQVFEPIFVRIEHGIYF